MKFKRGPYPPAAKAVQENRSSAERPQTASGAYTLAFQDLDFLLRDELRHIRMQLELLKPEIILQEHNIESTIVIFGSARIPEPETAHNHLKTLEERTAQDSGDPRAEKELQWARNRVACSGYYQEARRLGRLISRHTPDERMVVVTGGGPGIMEAANRGAGDEKQESIGLNIVLPREQTPNPYITPKLCFQFHYFAARKMHFLLRARGLVAFPGGFGTMDELFETLTLLQTKKIERIPVILFGPEFWKRIINFEALVEAGMIAEEDLKLFQFVHTAEEAWEILAAFNGIDAQPGASGTQPPDPL